MELILHYNVLCWF